MNKFFDNLIFENGVYYSKRKSSISYPVEANNTFYGIEENSFWYQHRNNCILETIDKFHPQGYLFEVGGGNGFVSKAIQELGYPMVLIEPDRNGILNAKKRGIDNLICSSFGNLEFSDNKLDNVCLFDVLEHIEYDFDFLKSVNFQLKEDGLLFLTVPSHNFLKSMEDQHDGHFRRYSLSEITNLLKLTDFEVEFKTYFFIYLLLPIYLFRVIPTKLGFGKFKSIEAYTKKQKVDTYEKTHKVKSDLISVFLSFLNKVEISLLRRNNRILFGASCLLVARKKRNVIKSE